jgi:hypothetical protein
MGVPPVPYTTTLPSGTLKPTRGDSQISMNALGRRMVHVMSFPWRRDSTARLERLSGVSATRLPENETKTNCPTPAAAAASTSASWPSPSTLTTVSPGCATPVAVAVEITAATPSQARARDSGAWRSPATIPTPSSRSRPTRAGSAVARTRARTS